jgi:Family of unknown function (DUF5670)
VLKVFPSEHLLREISRIINEEAVMFLGLFLVFFVCWIFGFVVFHVAGGLIHALLIVAAISLVWHFVRGRVRT